MKKYNKSRRNILGTHNQTLKNKNVPTIIESFIYKSCIKLSSLYNMAIQMFNLLKNI